MTYKNIIPGLVSIETDRSSFWGFSFSENFNFYSSSDKQKIHFKISVGDVKIPTKYEFRNGFYFKQGDSWYYERKIFNLIPLRFKFNPIERSFVVSSWYLKVPFTIGRILPFGKHAEDVISLELFLNGYVVLQGSAISYNDKNICIIGPSFNGKTFALKKIIEGQKGKIISDDIMIVDFVNNLVYPMPHKFKALGVREIQKKISKIVTKEDVVTEPVKISRLFFIQNSTSENKNNVKTRNFFEFISLCSFFFLDNRFIASYIFEEKLLDRIISKINALKTMEIKNCDFINIHNFDYEFLNLLAYDETTKPERAVE